MLAELFATARSHEPHAEQATDWRRGPLRVLEAVCAMRGHDYLQHAEAGRLFLRCVDCGHETHGWDIDIHA